ncbi:transcription antitermination factor NusB [uncultured Agitococcus sp.]|uniref:transcription antitermination factor NusB n=1 Tax=uncultured Agitococcus sp. TaxID=1506599 RepID=UPI002608F441|nr:transcription antitermination factor NusB [uncultured Agitococcus sp.]
MQTHPNKPQAKNTPAARHKARRFALQGLYEWQLSGNQPFEIEARYRVENAMHKVDLAYFHELLHQVVAKNRELDNAFEPFLDRKMQQLDPVERNILRIGSYELIHHIEIPYKIILNEAVELAKDFGATDSYKYVNSILDELAKTVRKAEKQVQ